MDKWVNECQKKNTLDFKVIVEDCQTTRMGACLNLLNHRLLIKKKLIQIMTLCGLD